MDPLSALAVAAAVVQFVDFGTRILGKLKENHKNSSNWDFPDFSTEAAFLSGAIREAVDCLSAELDQVAWVEPQCEKIAAQLERLVNADSKARSQQNHRNDKGYRKRWSQSVEHSNHRDAEAQIERMNRELQDVRSQVMMVVLSCLW
jgi:type I site-specific restriction-modification system R (restriction) subunit